MSDTPSADAQPSRGTVRLSGVTKAYMLGSRRVDALRGIDLNISEPGFYAIMGPSGSGKSTLLHLLAGLDRPDSGQVVVSGMRLDTMSESQLTMFRRHDIGIVFQQFNLIPTFTALENVTLPAMLDGLPHSEYRARGEELLDSLGLLPRAAHRPDALSGGEQQRAAIARALLFRPTVLLADEPTGNLDSASGEGILRLLEELHRELNSTILLVTHDEYTAASCERILILRDGRVAEDRLRGSSDNSRLTEEV
jgi:putative ABC transport system ATP-binding protein